MAKAPVTFASQSVVVISQFLVARPGHRSVPEPGIGPTEKALTAPEQSRPSLPTAGAKNQIPLAAESTSDRNEVQHQGGRRAVVVEH